MELEDLIIQHYRVERVNREMVVTPDPDGNYRANSAEAVKMALSNPNPPDGVDVKIGNKWFPIKRVNRRYKRKYLH